MLLAINALEIGGTYTHIHTHTHIPILDWPDLTMYYVATITLLVVRLQKVARCQVFEVPKHIEIM